VEGVITETQGVLRRTLWKCVCHYYGWTGLFLVDFTRTMDFGFM